MCKSVSSVYQMSKTDQNITDIICHGAWYKYNKNKSPGVRSFRFVSCFANTECKLNKQKKTL